MSNYWNNGNAVAFSRGNKGFFAMAKQGSMSENLQTGQFRFPMIHNPKFFTKKSTMLSCYEIKVYLPEVIATLLTIALHRFKSEAMAWHRSQLITTKNLF
jgi:hypothetical protein